MNIMQPEQLFLLEFLVDSLYIHRLCGREINQREWLSAGQSVITFQFLNFQMQAISDNDFPCPGTATGGPQKFESGKSCLFSIPDRDLSAPGKFIVYVGVLKRQPPGIVPETLLVGEAQIDITEQFTTVLSEIAAHPKEVPASSAIKEPFVIHYPETNEPVGQIHLFLRLSCFGKSIVTEFSLGNGQSYLFKGNEDSIYRCQAVDGVKSGGDSVTGCGKTINTDGCAAAAGGANAMNYGGQGGYPTYGPPMSQFAQTAAYPGYGMVNPSAGYVGPRRSGKPHSPTSCPRPRNELLWLGHGARPPPPPSCSAPALFHSWFPAAPIPGGGCGAGGSVGTSGCGGQRALPCGHSTPPSTFNPCGAGGFFVQIPQCKPGPGPCSDVAIYKLTKRAPGDPSLMGAEPGLPGGPGGGIGMGATGGALVPCDAPTPDAYVLRIKRTCPRGCDQRELLELACRPPPAPPQAAAETQAGGKKKKKKKKKGKKGKKKKK